MGALAFRFLVGIATAYLGTIGILWTFQAGFIYPAPQNPAPLTPGYEEVYVQTKDGLSLRAFYREAADDLPTVVYFHGNGGTLSGASVSNGAIAEAGLGVLLLEYRGYGGNPGEPSEQGFYRDGDAAIAWLADQGVPPARTVIIGNSIGSGVAVEMAVRHDPAALVLIAPFTSLPDAASENLWWMPVDLLMEDRFDSQSKLPKVSSPILVQHGSADTLIPDSQGRALADVSAQAEFQSFEGSGHDLSFERRSQQARLEWILGLDVRDVDEL